MEGRREGELLGQRRWVGRQEAAAAVMMGVTHLSVRVQCETNLEGRQTEREDGAGERGGSGGESGRVEEEEDGGRTAGAETDGTGVSVGLLQGRPTWSLCPPAPFLSSFDSGSKVTPHTRITSGANSSVLQH